MPVYKPYTGIFLSSFSKKGRGKALHPPGGEGEGAAGGRNLTEEVKT